MQSEKKTSIAPTRIPQAPPVQQSASPVKPTSSATTSEVPKEYFSIKGGNSDNLKFAVSTNAALQNMNVSLKSTQKEFALLNTQAEGVANNIAKMVSSFDLVSMASKLAKQAILQVFDNAKQKITDVMEMFDDVGNQYKRQEHKDAQKRNEKSQALSELGEMQLQDGPLNNVQRLQTARHVETLKKGNRDLNVDIDPESGKIKNFEEVQSSVLTKNKEQEMASIQKRMDNLRKSANFGNQQIKRGSGASEHWGSFKEVIGKGASAEVMAQRKRDLEELIKLNERYFELKGQNPAKDADEMFTARKKDLKMATQDTIAAEQQPEAQKNASASPKEQNHSSPIQQQLDLEKNKVLPSEAETLIQKVSSFSYNLIGMKASPSPFGAMDAAPLAKRGDFARNAPNVEPSRFEQDLLTCSKQQLDLLRQIETNGKQQGVF